MGKAERLATYVRRIGPGHLFPRNATGINVYDLHKLKAQGTSSEMYSFIATYFCESAERRSAFILRMYKSYAAKKGPKEYATLKTLKEQNISVPSAYILEMNKKVIGKPFMIMEKIAGVSASHFLDDEEQALATVDELAKTLTIIHKLDPICLNYGKLPEKTYEFAQLKLSRIKNDINAGCILALALLRRRRYLEAVRRLENVLPRRNLHYAVIHGDYGPDHVLVANERFVVVDLEGVCIGDPAWDVGWTYHILKLEGQTVIDHTFVRSQKQNAIKADLGEHFVKRYEKHMGQKMVNLDFYKDVTALRLAALFDLDLCPRFLAIPRSLMFRGMKHTLNHILSPRSIKSFRNYCLEFLENRDVLPRQYAAWTAQAHGR